MSSSRNTQPTRPHHVLGLGSMRFFRRGAGLAPSAVAASDTGMVGGMRDMAIPAASSSSNCLRRSSKRADEDEAKPLAAQRSDDAAANADVGAAAAAAVAGRESRHRRDAWRAIAFMMTMMRGVLLLVLVRRTGADGNDFRMCLPVGGVDVVMGKP